MERWRAETAWLGGAGLTADITIEVTDSTITHIAVDDTGPWDHHLQGIVIPGTVSAHSHAFHRALRGRTNEGSGDFWSWRAPMYRLANQLTPDTYHALAVAVFTEMVLAGITTVGEFHYLHHDLNAKPYADPNAMGKALVEAARDVGIRLTLIDAAYTTSDVAGAVVTSEQSRFSDRTINEWSERVQALDQDLGTEEFVRLGVAAHSVRAVAANDLAVIARTAAELDAPLHIHVSEQLAENEACITHHGLTPVQILAREGFLSHHTTLVHATHLLPGDIDEIARSGSGVCLCPTTEADLGDGIGPANELAQVGVPLCLGSDSNATIDIFEEARRVEQYDRLRLKRRGIHRAHNLLIAATANGAHSLGWPGGGRIAVGAPADFVTLDPSTPDLGGTDRRTVAATVMAATRASVTDVVIGGRRVVKSGRMMRGKPWHEAARALDECWPGEDR
jgi:formiminoglutamate deiminase